MTFRCKQIFVYLHAYGYKVVKAGGGGGMKEGKMIKIIYRQDWSGGFFFKFFLRQTI